MIWIILIVVGLILLMSLSAWLSLPTCPECKSKKTELVSKDEIEREPVYFKEKQRIKEYRNASGDKQPFEWQTRLSTNKYINAPEKVIEKEVLIEGERIWYDVAYKCSMCGEIFHRTEHKDEKPTVISE